MRALNKLSVPHVLPRILNPARKAHDKAMANGNRAHRQSFSEIVLAAAAVSPTASRTMPGKPRMNASQ